MNIFSRLALGTANWGAPYGHRRVQCPRSEQEKIVEYAHCNGIETLCAKPEYEVDLSWVPTCFDILTSHEAGSVSPYQPKDLPIRTDGKRWSYVNIPYSPFNRTWESWLLRSGEVAEAVHVRSVFVQGKVFSSTEPAFVRFRQYAGQLGLPAGTLCIAFCLLNPHIDKVVIGVDSVGQLKDNLRFFHRMKSFAVDDERITDPRTWKESQ